MIGIFYVLTLEKEIFLGKTINTVTKFIFVIKFKEIESYMCLTRPQSLFSIVLKEKNLGFINFGSFLLMKS